MSEHEDWLPHSVHNRVRKTPPTESAYSRVFSLFIDVALDLVSTIAANESLALKAIAINGAWRVPDEIHPMATLRAPLS